ncbi:uncharacterized protein VP01_6187g2 [Puccinia sorghi]|uniref:Uncharacterized protein n=1 Tax=Puccinia sorghi TaxID=27349 RepID=A0A0L6UHK5_9BASI|nr:uncharacterized protein VP01_6187g2 [Puccinia sorghi]
MTQLSKSANVNYPLNPTPPPPPPNTNTLHHLLQSVPKLEVNGDNYHTWVVMLQQALLGTLLRPIDLLSNDLQLSETDDMLLKIALTLTVDDGIKVGVAECKTELLDLRFNLYNKSADLNSHFHKVENLTKRLMRSGFEVTEESLTGLFFQLSLPNPESYPFVNILRQLDFCMEAGDYEVTNADLLLLAKTELSLFQQSKKTNNDRRSEKAPATKSSESQQTSGQPSSGANKGSSGLFGHITKWCPKCQTRDHALADCPKNSAPTQASTSQRSATAPPRPTFSINSATLE